MKQITRVCVALLVVAGMTGCVSRAEMDELKTNQEKILKKTMEFLHLRYIGQVQS